MEEDQRGLSTVSLLDVSGMGQSRIYVRKDYVPSAHRNDGTYLRKIIKHQRDYESSHDLFFKTPLTTFAIPKGWNNITFDVSVEYLHRTDGKCTKIFPCNCSTTVISLIDDSLSEWEPMDFSCSWIKSSSDDYAVYIPHTEEYLFDLDVNLLSMVYVRKCITNNEDINLVLTEKSKLHSSFKEEKCPSSPFDSTVCEYIESYKISDPLILRIHKISGLSDDVMHNIIGYGSLDKITLSISISIKHNTYELCKIVECFYFKYEDIGKSIDRDIGFPIPIKEIPREAFICISINAKHNTDTIAEKFLRTWVFMVPDESLDVAWGMCSVYDFQGNLRTNKTRIPMHLAQINPNSSPEYYVVMHDENSDGPSVTFSMKGAWTTQSTTIRKSYERENEELSAKDVRFKEKDWKKIMSGAASNKLMWKYKHHILDKAPEKLVTLLRNVDWEDQKHVSLVHDLLKRYICKDIAPHNNVVHPFSGLDILSVDMVDTLTREYAVGCLDGLSNEEVKSLIPQLIQSLKKDVYLSSSLAVFVLMRAINDKDVGHSFYWYLSSEMDDPIFNKRFELMMQIYLENIDYAIRQDLFAVSDLFDALIKIAKQSYDHNNESYLHRSLYDVKVPKQFHLPTSSCAVINKLVVEKCRILNSKTRPLWLTFVTNDDQEIYVILKVGDDIRVDVLALQMMNVLDAFWKKEGVDLHLQPYVALPLKKCVGLIQVTTKSETIATIGWSCGGNGFASAFSSTSLKAYLYKNNPSDKRDEAFRNFALSCAGYCVFTYVFGVGDRHGDNIMCTKQGNLFHIDFGYFLGERSKFLGISRETNFFVLTPNYINAMDKFFDLFVRMSCYGFVIAKRYETTFSTLIALMVPCGEDVLSRDQLRYVRNALEPLTTERESKEKFYNIILKSLQDKRTLINDFAHLIATRSGK